MHIININIQNQTMHAYPDSLDNIKLIEVKY